ncbi:MAG: DUF1697 domain-containing protein [Propionibacteriaceae bacterium]|nr:DUF1697 domain-containing protein [Propionibacteriaceae bacterium]
MTAPAPQTRPDRVAWLRGINVGGNKRVSMAQLRAVAVDLGWRQVSTHLNSGNLLFGAQGPASEVAAQLSEAIGERLGVEVAVLVREAADLGALLAANPFPEGDPSRVCVAFVDSAVSTQQWQRLEGPERPARAPRVPAPRPGDRLRQRSWPIGSGRQASGGPEARGGHRPQPADGAGCGGEAGGSSFAGGTDERVGRTSCPSPGLG